LDEDIYTIPQAAKFCVLSRGTIWKNVKSGELNASMTPGGHFRIQKKDLVDFMKRKKMFPVTDYNPGLKKILIVDDNPQFLKLLTMMLSGKGYKTDIAEDGFAAGIKILEFQPELIVLDIFMPGMNGFEVCKQVKEKITTSHIKILAITGYDSEENKDRILAAGADACLVKPFGNNTFVKTVKHLLTR